MLSLNIKISSGTSFSVSVEDTLTVAEFKVVLSEKANIPPEQQRLIYAGHVLKDPQTLQSYNVKDNTTVHLVRGAPPAARAAATPAAPAPVSAGTTAGSGSGSGDMMSNMMAAMMGNGTGAGGLGAGMPSMQQQMQQMQQQMAANPDMMRQMMDNPLVQSMLNNPEFIRSAMMSNPEMRALIEANPELAHVLNDPGTLRQMSELMRRPELMREYQRNADRAMSNLEMLPGGFDFLRRMHSQYQEPLMNAATSVARGASDPGAAAGGTGAQPQQQPAPDATPNAQPLPNPWGSRPPAGTVPPATPAAAAPATPASVGPSAGAATGLEQLFGMGSGGSAGGMPAGFDPMAILQNPMAQQMMQQMASDPALVQQMMQANPMTRQMLDSNPMMQQVLNNPQYLQFALDPRNMQAMLQMQQAMQQLQSSPLFGALTGSASGPSNAAGGFDAAAMFGAPATPGTSSAAPPQQPNPFSGWMQMMNSLPGLGLPSTAAAQQPPAERYASQNAALLEMGFTDQDANLRALVATQGNVQLAVERLLSGL
eukprot:TRINITY_DN320_c0_g1_i2.p1 TRINITY_DN320_c0_g1~~TRINITY_DN320_c0_g1_i2.p1  ORF type:complete len:539 (+),score=186.45 TRINITY_DN320_c0_g1_i2:500-2116(+)